MFELQIFDYFNAFELIERTGVKGVRPGPLVPTTTTIIHYSPLVASASKELSRYRLGRCKIAAALIVACRHAACRKSHSFKPR
jgi:hypothetical protein